MDTQTLNIKLEEWANVYREHVPFPDSLDACFKSLVPKLYLLGKQFQLINSNHAKIIDAFAREETIHGFAEKPALALCLAIEKLIEGGK